MSSELYNINEGECPLIISMPHSGTFVPDELLNKFTQKAAQLPDTDWYMDKLYQPIIEKFKPTVIYSNLSRYVIDLNRPPDDKPLYPGKAHIGLCPVRTFSGELIYKDHNEPDHHEIVRRTREYWSPYHLKLKELLEITRTHYGYAILLDAHSIRSELPDLFQGILPEINVGTVMGASCDDKMEEIIYEIISDTKYSSALNGRFIGGYITRHYGDPSNNIHAVQFEISQRAYMDEGSNKFDEEKSSLLSNLLIDVVDHVLEWSNSVYTPLLQAP